VIGLSAAHRAIAALPRSVQAVVGGRTTATSMRGPLPRRVAMRALNRRATTSRRRRSTRHRGRHDPAAVTAEYAKVLKYYGIGKVVGDRYAAEWVVGAWRRNGITYEQSELTRSENFFESRAAVLCELTQCGGFNARISVSVSPFSLPRDPVVVVSVTHSGQHSARQIRAQPRSVTVLLLAEPTRRPREREHVG
jgi:hypothetical protein